MAYGVGYVYHGRAGRNHLTNEDKEDIKRRIQRGENVLLVADNYNISEFTARKIAGVLLD